jgi:hypothetical protein
VFDGDGAKHFTVVRAERAVAVPTDTQFWVIQALVGFGTVGSCIWRPKTSHELRMRFAVSAAMIGA